MIKIRDKKARDLIPALRLVYSSFSDWYKKIILILLYSYFVAEVNGKLIGLVIPRKINNNIGEIYLIAVSKEYRRTGMGYKLLEKGLHYFKEENMSKCISWVRLSNDIAKRMYLKAGFKSKEERIKKRIFGEDLFLMEININRRKGLCKKTSK